MTDEGGGVGEREPAARLAGDTRLAGRPEAMAHRHLLRRIEVPELTTLLQQRSEYRPAALQRVDAGYLCEGCGTLGSIVYGGAEHPVHYLREPAAH